MMKNDEYEEAKERLSKLGPLKINLCQKELPLNYKFEKKENEKEFNSILEITKNLLDLQTITKYDNPSNLNYLNSILQSCYNKLFEIEYFDKTKDETISETIKSETISYEDYFKILIEKHENKMIDKIENNGIIFTQSNSKESLVQSVEIPKLKKKIIKNIKFNDEHPVNGDSNGSMIPDEEQLIEVLNFIKKDQFKYKKLILNLKNYLNLNFLKFDLKFINLFFKNNFNKSIKNEERVKP